MKNRKPRKRQLPKGRTKRQNDRAWGRFAKHPFEIKNLGVVGTSLRDFLMNKP